MSRLASMPATTRRLFAHYDLSSSFVDDAPGLVIGRVLEEGDTADLRWLFASFDDAQIGDWLEHHGSRQLSRRSLSFWKTILGREVPALPPAQEQLWPL